MLAKTLYVNHKNPAIKNWAGRIILALYDAIVINIFCNEMHHQNIVLNLDISSKLGCLKMQFQGFKI